MGKITIKSNGNEIIIVNKLIEKEAVNERILGAISSDILPNLLPITMERKRKETEINCTVNGMMSLRSYFSGSLSKKEFLRVVSSLIGVGRQCETCKINISNLELDIDSIFYNDTTKEVFCIYWPLVNNTRESNIGLFFKDLPQMATFSNESTGIFLIEYNSFFNGNNPFSLNSFERMISKLMNSNDDYKKADEGNKTKNETRNQEIEYDPLKAIKDRNEKLWRDISVKKREIDGDNTYKGTVVLNEVQVQSNNSPKAYIVRLKTNERVLICKEILIIGSGTDNSDYCITDNRTISRKHAQIERNGNEFFIRDLGSTNKTRVDNTVVLPNTPMKLSNGANIMLSNEAFKFEC